MQRNSPHPGQLRHMVEIGRTVNAANENGYPVETDEVVCRVWAGIEDDSSRYFIAGDAETAERGLCFVIRWRGDVTPGMWVRFRDEKWQISTLGEYEFKRAYLGLKASIAKGVSG